MIIYYIILGLLSMVFISAVVLFSKKEREDDFISDTCDVDEDCRDESKGGKPGAKCTYISEYDMKRCLTDDQNVCKIRGTDGFDWMKTDLDDVHDGDKSLTICQTDSDCDGCINQPQWGCFKQASISVNEIPPTIGTCKSEDGELCDSGGDKTCSYGRATDGKCRVTLPLVDEDGNEVNRSGEPTHGYCMPIVSDQRGLDGTSKCNSQTSDIFLTQSGEYSSQWSCLCKNPAMFSHESTSTSNCVHEKICGADAGVGKLMMDTGRQCSSGNDCGGGEACCVNGVDDVGNVCLGEDEVASDNETRTCHARWDKDNESDWFKNGKCLCEPGYTYVSEGDGIEDGTKLCVPDQCHSPDDHPFPSGFTKLHKQGEIGVCECPAGSKYPISCPGDFPSDLNTNQGNTKMFRLYNACKGFPMCVSDPCEAYGAEYVKGSGAIGAGTSCANCPKGTISKSTSANWTGSYCDDPCYNNGPCGTGADARGRCRVATRADGKRDVECVRPEVANARCENRAANEYCGWDGTCILEDGKCKDLPAGAGGCLCPWTNPCNQYNSKDSCESQDGICAWRDGPYTKSPFTTGQHCVLSDYALDLEIKIDDNGNVYKPYQNICSRKQPGIGAPKTRCIPGENSCCNSIRDDYSKCTDSIFDIGERIYGINIGRCGAYIPYLSD